MARIVHTSLETESGDIARDGSTSITETLKLYLSDDVSLEWITANIAPQMNREHKDHPGYYYERINPKRTKRLVWSVELVSTPFQLTNLPEDPLQRTAVITCGGSLVTEPTNFDYKDRPITTTAGEFIAGVERERPMLVYHVSKNVGRDPDWLETHIGAVNLDAVTLRGRRRGKGTLKLVNPELSDYQVENRVRFCTVSFDLLFDPIGHAVERWNMGTLQLINKKIDGKSRWFQTQIMTLTQPVQPVDAPVALDRRGAVLEDYLKSSDDGRPVDVSKLIKLTFDVQPQRAFNGVLPLK